MDHFEPIAGDLLKPIAGSSPAGVDARLDADHESLRAELDKLNSLAKATVSWPDVDRIATHILQSKSKDILAATYGAAAWMELAGGPGLMRGIATLGGILARFPHAAFPTRLRARANAVSWFVDRATAWLGRKDANGLDQDGASALALLARQTASAARSALGDDCPSFTPLERAIERFALSAPTNAVPQVLHASPLDSAAAAAPPPPAESDSAVTSSAAEAPAISSERAERQRAMAWLEPIPGDAPCGVELIYEDALSELQAQIGRLESPTAAQPDWLRVHYLADELLRTRSKDLLVACYLAAALFELEDVPGLATGLWLVSELSERYWESMWPPPARARRRAGAVQWLATRAGTRLVQRTTEIPEPQLAALGAALDSFRMLTRTRLRGETLNIRVLWDFVMPKLAPKETPAPLPPSPPSSAQIRPPAVTVEPEKAPVAPPAPRLALPEAPSDAPTDAAQVAPFVRSLGERLVQTARLLRTANSAEPSAYRLLRQGVWLHIDKAPPRDAGKRTRIPAPQKRVVDVLASLAAAEKWEALLTQAEGSVQTSPLWLDLHWYAARALAGLGPEHSAARDALELETRALIHRLPELLDSCFQDGSPLAGPEARTWLKPSQPSSSQAASSQPRSLAEAGLTAEHQALLAAGTKDGLARVQEALDAHRAERDRFVCRLDMAQGLAAKGHTVQALAVYRSLALDVDTFVLERWEPALAARVLAAYWACLRAGGSPQGVVSEEARGLCAKLARLAPEALFE